jgi:hypothetical protein
MRKTKQKFKSKGKRDVYPAHACHVSDGGPYLAMDFVRRVQPLQSLLLLPSLSSFFFSTRQKAPLEVIKLSKAYNFNSFRSELAYTWENMCN